MVMDGVTVAVSELSYSVRPRSVFKLCSKDRVELLHEVNFLARPGTLTVILGPSGCGKTTLLNVISSRARGKITRGAVAFNGQQIPAHKLKGAVALLNANDRLLAYLNVRETLMFTAYLRMPNATKQQREAQVEQVMADLALTHAQNTLVGGAWRKGLSSGEMRRCSIAMELMGNPSVLLLDEPSSGLDAVLAYEVVSVLKKLALRGKTVVCTLHQPRSSVCRLFDNVAVMAKGNLIFQGSLTEAHTHFLSTLHRDIGRQGNYADELLDIANGIEDEGDKNMEEELSSGKMQTSSAGEPTTKPPAAYTSAVWQEAVAVWVASSLAKKQEAEIKAELAHAREVPIPTCKSQKNCVIRYLMEIYGVAYRTFRNSWNNPMALLMSILVQASMGIFLGFIFFRLPHKFLPEKMPVDIGDPSSPAMQIIESPLVRFLLDGVDDAGTNPLLDMIMYGVDGRGSDPIKTFLQSGDATSLGSAGAPSVTSFRLANMVPCVVRRLKLENTGWYMKTLDYEKYYADWSDGVPTAEKDPRYNEPLNNTSLDKGNYFVFGEYNPPASVQSLVQTLQFFDYMFYNLPWREVHETCLKNYKSQYVPCFGCHGEIGAFLDAASECTEIPEQPKNILAMCTARVPGGKDESEPTVTVFDENGNFKRGSNGALLYPRRIPPKPTGKSAEDSSAPKRRLQISGLMGGGVDLSTMIPPSLLGLVDTKERYENAIKECTHPVCAKLGEYLTGSSSESNWLADYASVVGAVMNVAGALFFSVAALGFGAYDGLTGLCYDRPLINRELMNNTYKASSYFIGRTLGDAIFHLIPGFCLVTPFYFIIDLDKGPGCWWFGRYLLICLVSGCTAYGFSYAISSLSPTMEVAVISAPLSLVVLLCCSGFFVRDSAIPDSMAWLKYISFYRWGFFSMMLNQFPLGESYWGVPNSFNLALIGVNETSLWKCLGVMLGLAAAFRVIAYIGLKYTNRSIGVET